MIITTQNDASILIVICNPVFPELEIVNKTDSVIEFAQLKDGSIISGLTRILQDPANNVEGQLLKVKPKMIMPFAWTQRQSETKRLCLLIDGHYFDIGVEKENDKVELPVGEDDHARTYTAEILMSGNSKIV